MGVHFDHWKACKRTGRTLQSVLTTAKRVRGLQSFRECVLPTAKRVGGLKSFGEFVFTTKKHVGGLQTAKRVGGLQRFGKYVLTNAKLVGGLQSFGEFILTIRKACRRLAEVCRIRTSKGVGDLHSFVPCVLTSENRVEACRSLQGRF